MNSAVKTINCRPPKGIDGRNICVVTLDTGICPCADLPLKRILFFKDFVNGKEQPYDDNGHGTHVAGYKCKFLFSEFYWTDEIS